MMETKEQTTTQAVFPMLNRTKIILNNCIYPDGEGGFGTGKHNFDKKGFCIICGKTKEQ